MSDLPNYFDTFRPVRVKQGEAVSRIELIRRLAHYLHVPQRFGERLMNAFESVLSDALLHGEGFKIKNAGTLTLQRHTTEYVMMFNEQVERKILYKYKWYVCEEAKRFLERISELDKEGVIDDFFQDA